MSDEKQLELLKKGVAGWNEWRKENRGVEVDLGWMTDEGKAILADLAGASLRGVNLRGADLSWANFNRADLSWADLSKASLSVASLERANLERANLTGANLSNAKLTAANLYWANLFGANLFGANLSGANLSGADLSKANLRWVRLLKTDLSKAHLRKANLVRADLSGADLSKANLSKATLCGANLVRADLSGADLSKGSLGETVFGNTNLTGATGLGAHYHFGPSILDHRTLEKSGMLPIEFLRGCGLTDWQIEATKLHQRNLTNSKITEIVYEIDRLRANLAIQITNLFISYTHNDGAFVDHVQKHLDEKGVRHWRDIHDAPAGPMGAIVVRTMSDATVLLILSKRSVESDWVRFEAEKARELEKTLGRHILCPIALDDAWKNCKWPKRLRLQIEDYNILDFSDWQGDKFKKKFDKLLEGLNLYFTPNDD